MDKWLICVALVNLLNFFYTTNVFYSRQVIAVNLCSLCLCWIAAQVVNSESRRRWILTVIIASGCAVSLEAVAQVFLSKGILLPWAVSGAAIGSIGNTNYVGAFLLFSIFACLSLLPQRWAILIPSLLLTLGALVLSRARASWVGLAAGVTVWLWMAMPRRYFVSVVAAGCLAGVVAWSAMPETWKNANTMGYRLKYWAAAVELWRGSPLLGIGFDGYRHQVYEAQARIAEKDKDFFKGYVDPKPRRVHNEYLQALVDGGLLYFGVYFGFVFWVLARSYGAARMNPTIRGIWCASLSILTAALFFFPFRLVDTAMLFHVQLGILASNLRPVSPARLGQS